MLFYEEMCFRPAQKSTSCRRRDENAIVYDDGRVGYVWQDTLYTYSCVVMLHFRKQPISYTF